MGRRGFIAYDPDLARERFNADPVIAIYYLKLLRYDRILSKGDDGFFTVSAKRVEKATCITRRQQERARKWLEGHAFIVMKLKTPEGRTSPQLHYKLIDYIAEI